MRTALLLSGHLRTYKECLKSHESNILSVLNPDVFVHTWDETEAKNHHNSDKAIKVSDDDVHNLQKVYSPVNYKIETQNLENIEVISDRIIKSEVLLNSVFAVAKSGTVSLEICNAKVPSIIIYKINLINFLIMKSLVKVKFANIINIINNEEIIPELLQGECNAKEIFRSVVYFLKNPSLAQKQVDACSHTLNHIRSKSSSSEEAAKILSEYLIV